MPGLLSLFPLVVMAQLAAPTIDSPSSGAVLCSTSVAFTGSATYLGLSTNTVSVVVGQASGAATVDSSGGWAVTLDVGADGDFQASATETQVTAGASATSAPAVVLFSVASTSPSIAITEPSVPRQTYVTGSPLFEGTATAGDVVSLQVGPPGPGGPGGMPGGPSQGTASVTASASGAWAASITLSPGGSGDYQLTATVSAPSSCNLTSSVSQSFTIDDTPPTIDSPPPGSMLMSPSVTLSGKGPDGAAILVSVNGGDTVEAAIDNKRWTVSAVLAPGDNAISVEAQDATGALSAPAVATYSVIGGTSTTAGLTIATAASSSAATTAADTGSTSMGSPPPTMAATTGGGATGSSPGAATTGPMASTAGETAGTSGTSAPSTRDASTASTGGHGVTRDATSSTTEGAGDLAASASSELRGGTTGPATPRSFYGGWSCSGGGPGTGLVALLACAALRSRSARRRRRDWPGC